MWGFIAYTLFFKYPIDKIANTHTSEELKASIRREIDSISEDELILVCCTAPKKLPEMCGWGRITLPASHVMMFVIIFLVILLNYRPPCDGGIAFVLPAGTWAISGCHRWPPCYGRHLSEKYCSWIDFEIIEIWRVTFLHIITGPENSWYNSENSIESSEHDLALCYLINESDKLDIK